MSNSTRPRRVLIIVQNLPVPFDRRVWNEANALAAAGYEVTVICPKGRGASAKHEVIGGIHIYRHALPLEARGALGYLFEYGSTLFFETWLAWKIFFKRGFDVIHACNPPDMIFLVALPFKLFFGKRFIFDHHDLNPELYISKFGRKDFFYRLLRWFEYYTFRVADVSIATNNSYRAAAIERGRMAPEKVFVVRSGPNLERLRIVSPDEKLKKGRRYLVGYVGVISESEGIDLLLDAVDHIVRKRGREDIHFGIVGGGPELEAVKALATKMQLDDYVTFTGRASDQALLAMLNTADVCVNPERVNDMTDKSTMNKIMEYMALGKPMVQFDVTEGRFSAQDASLYAKPNDVVDLAEKLLALIDDPERRKSMGVSGRRRVCEQLAWPYEVPKLLSAYERAFAAKERRAKPSAEIPDGSISQQ